MPSIEKRTRAGQVRWYARYRDPAGQQRTKTFDRKVDAEKYLVTVEGSKLTNSYIDPRAGVATFGQYFTEWSARQVWTPGTVRAMDLAVRTTTFAAVRLRDLRPSHLETWVKAMQVKGLAPGTIRTRFNNVRSVLRAATRDRLIASDPSSDVRLPRIRSREASMTIPTTAQVGALLATADPAFRPFIALCAFAGLRLGEAAAVQIGDVDFLRRTLAVQRQVQRASGKAIEIRAPKYGSERTVYLPDELVQLLAQHLETMPSREPASWLFVGEASGPPHQNTVGHRWRLTCAAAGVTGIRLHDLRHFFASGLIAEGCDVVTVQRALGHKSATTTLTTYSHLWPSAEDRTRAASGRLLSAALADVYPSCTEEAGNAV
jgi:integrase